MGVFTPTPTQALLGGPFAKPTSGHLADEKCGYAGKMEEEGASTQESSKSPASYPTAYEADVDDDAALELMGPPALNRLSTDDHFYPSHATVNPAYGMATEPRGVPLETIMPQQDMAPRQMEPMHYQEVAPVDMQSNQPISPSMQQNNTPEVDMNNTMVAPVSPNNQTMMYTDVMMQQAMQQAMQQGQMQQWQHGGVQYVPVPTPVPVQMMPQMVPQMVPVPVPMNFSVPGQMQQAYYMMPQGAEQQREEAPKGDFLESLMPKGWRKRQRPSKRPASRVQKVPNGRKIFVGGLSPNSTADSLIKHFCEFGKISDASVIHEAVSRKSRGFGYVEFQEKIPDGLLEMEHFIDQRRCGVRGYNYDPAEDTVVAAASAA
jgi:hypothetical protein